MSLPLTRIETVHVLHHGRPICGFSEKVFPAEWPPGHSWVRWEEFGECLLELRCPRCAEALGRRQTFRE